MNIAVINRVGNSMRNEALVIVAAVLLVFSTVAVGAGNPAASNPLVPQSGISSGGVGSGLAPVSSYQSGLTRVPNPINSSGNLVVTGNVSGGKYFRGVVPYNAISDFAGRLGTTDIDRFLRYSDIPADRPYTGRLRPYFSPTRTVTTLEPGMRGVVMKPQAASFSGYKVE